MVFVSKGEAESDSPDPTGERALPPKALLLLDGLNERLLKDVVGGLLISGNGRQRIPEPEVLFAVQIFELGESGVHVPKSL